MSKSDFDESDAAPNLVALGKLISKKRRQMKLSVSELAAIAEVDATDIEKLEAGVWDVDVVLLLEIAQVLRHRLSTDMKSPPFSS